MGVPRRVDVLVRLGAVVSLVLGVVACGETSTVDPNAVVTISGRIRTPSGDPLADRPVRLASGSSLDDALFAVVTLGLACTEGICDGAVRSGRTNGDGVYRFEVRGHDTQTSFGNVRTQVVSASAAPSGNQVSGASVAARFVVQTEQLRLPPLQLVDPALSLEAGPGRVDVSWQPSPGAPYTLAFETDAVVPVWRVTTTETEAGFDSRALEGSSGRVVLSGETEDEIMGSDLDLTWRSPGVGYAAAGAPVSRGAACSYGRPGSPSSHAGGDCGLTDGDLFFAETPVAECAARPSPPARRRRCKRPTTATIEMASAASVDLIVVRGCEGNCLVEVSSDGRRWRTAGTATDPFSAVPLTATSVRWVRVGLGIAGLREVSIWAPPPEPEPGVEPVSEGALEALREPYAFAEASGVSGVALLVAGVLLVAVIVAVAYRVGRRRGASAPS